MVVATRYDELEAWQLADALKKQVYELLETVTAEEDRGHELLAKGEHCAPST